MVTFINEVTQVGSRGGGRICGTMFEVVRKYVPFLCDRGGGGQIISDLRDVIYGCPLFVCYNIASGMLLWAEAFMF